jgi:hypothetical protein
MPAAPPSSAGVVRRTLGMVANSACVSTRPWACSSLFNSGITPGSWAAVSANQESRCAGCRPRASSSSASARVQSWGGGFMVLPCGFVRWFVHSNAAPGQIRPDGSSKIAAASIQRSSNNTNSAARALVHSRRTVRSETPRASATSASVRPPKNRISTKAARSGLTRCKSFSASSTA